MAKNEITILANTIEIAGWKSVSITRSLTSLAHSFDLSMVSRVKLDPLIQTQQPVSVLLDGDVLLSGYIDTVVPTKNASGFSLQVTGRSRTGDLVDCSAVNSPGKWKSISLGSLLYALTRPFGINVVFNEGVDQGKLFDSFSINSGEKVYEAIQRACALRNVIPTTNANGDLFITTATSDLQAYYLVDGENILTISQNISTINRYSNYTVSGQNTKPGSGYSAKTIGITGSAEDTGITRYRPLFIKANDRLDKTTARNLAAWEARIRYGKSRSIDITVVEWNTPEDVIWSPNQMYNILSEDLNIDNKFLLTDVELTMGSSGRLASLKFMDPLAFDPEPNVPKPVIKPKVKTGGW